MGKPYSSRRERKKLAVFFVLMVIFALLTFFGGVLVIRHHYHTLYSLIPALVTIVFLQLCKRTRRRIERHES